MDERKLQDQKEQLIARYRMNGYIKTQEVIRALRMVPREEFIGPNIKRMAYLDRPLPILAGQTISAPHMVAMMVSKEVLDLKIGDRCLEVGAGSGYHAAVIAEIVAPTGTEEKNWGHVYTIERIKELVDFAKANLERTNYTSRVTVIHGDGSLGYPEEAPYDKITVACAAPDIPPPLLEQLKPGGRLVIPVAGGGYFQELKVIFKRKDGSIKSETKCGVAFVPLIGKYGYK